MQLVLQGMFDLALQIRGNVVPMGEVANAGQRLDPAKGVSGGGQPRIYLSNDERIVGRRQLSQPLLNPQGDPRMMRGTEVPSVLGTGNLAGAEESQVDDEIDQLLGRERGVFLGQEPEDQIQLLTPASGAFVGGHQRNAKVFLAHGGAGFRSAIADVSQWC